MLDWLNLIDDAVIGLWIVGVQVALAIALLAPLLYGPKGAPVGRIFFKRRNDFGYSRAKLAKLAVVAESVIKRLEDYNELPSKEAFGRICGILDLDPTLYY